MADLLAPDLIAFVFVSAVEVLTSILVVTARRLVWATFWLAMSLSSLAGLYVLFGAELLAVIQIVVYAGAVVPLFLFGIMLTRPGTLEEST